MSKGKTNGATNTGGAINPDARYSVRLKKPVQRGRRVLSPQFAHVMTGRVLAELPSEVIAHVEPV